MRLPDGHRGRLRPAGRVDPAGKAVAQRGLGLRQRLVVGVSHGLRQVEQIEGAVQGREGPRPAQVVLVHRQGRAVGRRRVPIEALGRPVDPHELGDHRLDRRLQPALRVHLDVLEVGPPEQVERDGVLAATLRVLAQHYLRVIRIGAVHELAVHVDERLGPEQRVLDALQTQVQGRRLAVEAGGDPHARPEPYRDVDVLQRTELGPRTVVERRGFGARQLAGPDAPVGDRRPFAVDVGRDLVDAALELLGGVSEVGDHLVSCSLTRHAGMVRQPTDRSATTPKWSDSLVCS